jgi:hypothetical protein
VRNLGETRPSTQYKDPERADRWHPKGGRTFRLVRGAGFGQDPPVDFARIVDAANLDAVAEGGRLFTLRHWRWCAHPAFELMGQGRRPPPLLVSCLHLSGVCPNAISRKAGG